MQPDHPRKLTLMRHADHDPGLVCRPALGYGLCEVLEPDLSGGYGDQSRTACCPRQTIPDSCSCLEGCGCMCLDCDCTGWGEEHEDG